MVDMNNCEEYMLLYADRELSSEQEQELLAFVAKHPELKAELDMYAATRLVPEAIIYDSKEQLIKTEPQKKTLNIWIDRRMWAAAASVVLFVVLFSVTRNDEEEIEAPAVAVQTIVEPIKTQVEETIIEPIEKPTVQATQKMETGHKKFHSTKPVNAVAVRREQKEEKLQVPEPILPEEEPKQPTEVVVLEQKDTTVHIAKVIEEETPQVKRAITAPAETRRRNKFIAAVIGNKAEGINNIGGVVNEKLAAVKNKGRELKGTELTFEFRNKELFTVRL